MTRQYGQRSGTRPPGVGVRLWQTGDTDAINRLYNDPRVRPAADTTGYVPRTASQWTWEFASPPPQDAPAYAVATSAGHIIGVQAYIPIELLIDGTVVRSGKDEDTLIHPDYRGMGLLNDMYRLLFQRAEHDGVAVLWGFTNTAVRPLLRNGYHSIGSFEIMRADLSQPPGNAADGKLAAPRRMLQRIRKTAKGAEHANRLVVNELREPNERCSRFSVEFGRQIGGIMLHLSAQFLRWRLRDNPFRQHRLYAAHEQDRIVGLAAFKLDDERAVGYVSELAALSTERNSAAEILDALLRPGLELFRSRRYRSAEARTSGQHPFNETVRSVLARHGFIPEPSGQAMEFLVRPMATGDERYLNISEWRINEIMREY